MSIKYKIIYMYILGRSGRVAEYSQDQNNYFLTMSDGFGCIILRPEK